MTERRHRRSKAGPDRILDIASSRNWHIWKDLTKAAVSLFLGALYSRVSLLSLAPVYGSTPAHIYHDAVCTFAILAVYPLESFLFGSFGKAHTLLPGVALSIPIFQSFLFQRSSLFGNPAGPVLTELMTTVPLLLLSASTFFRLSNTLGFSQSTSMVAKLIPTIAGILLFRLSDFSANYFVPFYIGSSSMATTFVMQVIIASLYAVLFPSYRSWAFFSVPAAYLLLATHFDVPFVRTTANVNLELQKVNYILVERQESLTGYISVLDNTQHGFRAMRCDHSLLGGEWTNRPSHYNPRVSDPIYAVFTMLEAVRLVETESDATRKVDLDSSALVIGLGIGTTPAALIQHGIETTIVEIDPVVYQFAVQHFDFPPNHTAIIDNAASFVEAAQHSPKQYDYIIHDVFTGGVEPVELFTIEFMQGLSALLKDDGVVAINYAGDISLPGAGLVVRTIRRIFHQCRIYRENDGSETSAEESPSFINMVIFCKKTRASTLTFRPPIEDDYLGSQFRMSYMYPRHEIDFSVFGMPDNSTSQQILENGKTSILEPYHVQNAIGHWNIMRNVLPAQVWEIF